VARRGRTATCSPTTDAETDALLIELVAAKLVAAISLQQRGYACRKLGGERLVVQPEIRLSPCLQHDEA
jgi:hypothetical protein